MGFEGLGRRVETPKVFESSPVEVHTLTGEDGKFYSLDHGGVIESVRGGAIGYQVRIEGIPEPLHYDRDEQINVRLV